MNNELSSNIAFWVWVKGLKIRTRWWKFWSLSPLDRGSWLKLSPQQDKILNYSEMAECGQNNSIENFTRVQRIKSSILFLCNMWRKDDCNMYRKTAATYRATMFSLCWIHHKNCEDLEFCKKSTTLENFLIISINVNSNRRLQTVRTCRALL